MAAYVGMWMVPTLIGTTASLVTNEPDATFNWIEYLSLYFGYWLIWVIATPLIYRLLILSPIDRPQRSTALLIVANIVLLCAIVAMSHLYLMFVDFTNDVGPFTRAQYIERTFSANSLWFNASHPIKYAFIALACVLVRQYRLRLREERNRAEADIRNRVLESKLATARLSLLQSQVQPHVFLNALNGVAALIDAGRHDTAKEAIQDIADFLRRTLSALESPRLPFMEDLELTKAYIRVLTLRFGDRIDAEVEISPDAEALAVPSLLTQPLVENIAKHVIERSSDRVSFKISATRSENYLDIRVDDSGLKSESTMLPTTKGNGIGIPNLRKRLDAMYNGAASMEISDSSMGGQSVLLRIPLVDGGDTALDDSV